MNFSHFISHLEEFRARLIAVIAVFGAGLLLGFIFSDPIIHWLTRPMALLRPGGLVFFKPHEAFLIHVQVAMMSGAVIAIPVLIVQGWQFAAPGLYPHEKKTAAAVSLISAGLFLTGVLFAYYAAAPWGLKFLLSFQGPELKPLLSAQEYFSFLAGMFAAFGLLFVFPVLIVGAVKLGIVSPEVLTRSRRGAVVIIFITAAVLTPSPDPASQVLLAAPLLLLYEGSVWFSRRVKPI
ncbi:MAG: twin-arginine translocase subunit TatC [Candidatus Omnitrophica bacterium]|nr:twin-arginine translocase subunit TatC [Candidatus Omnitrophota bacterium]